MLEPLTEQDMALRFIVAALCATVIGIERELKHKNAGIRTYILVCLGAAGFTMLILNITAYLVSVGIEADVDPARIIQGIVTGLGFLGGGAILQRGSDVSGVATGAGIWVAGAIGIACGFGFYSMALILTAAVFLVLGLLGVLRAHFREDVESDDENECKETESDK